MAAMASRLTPRLMAWVARVWRSWCGWPCPMPASRAQRVSRRRGWIGVSDLGRRAGVSKPSAFRLLGALEADGYVERDGANYCLGRQVFELGNRIRPCRPGGLREGVWCAATPTRAFAASTGSRSHHLPAQVERKRRLFVAGSGAISTWHSQETLPSLPVHQRTVPLMSSPQVKNGRREAPLETPDYSDAVSARREYKEPVRRPAQNRQFHVAPTEFESVSPP